jgi:hypothetical protein
MYLVHVLTRHKSTLGISIVIRYTAVARLLLFNSFVPTPRLALVVYVIVRSVTVTVITYAQVSLHIERVCTLQQVMGPRLEAFTRGSFFGELRFTTRPRKASV